MQEYIQVSFTNLFSNLRIQVLYIPQPLHITQNLFQIPSIVEGARVGLSTHRLEINLIKLDFIFSLA